MATAESSKAAAGNRIDGVLAPNDAIADVVLASLRLRQLPMVPVTGLGGGTAALQRIAIDLLKHLDLPHELIFRLHNLVQDVLSFNFFLVDSFDIFLLQLVESGPIFTSAGRR